MITWWRGSYTIEYWMYANAFTQDISAGATGVSPVVGAMVPTSTEIYWSFGTIANGTVKFYYYNGSPQSFVTSTALATAQWYHLAFVNNSGALTIYINGVSSATSTVAGTPLTGATFTIGAVNNVGYNGYIDDLRITMGVARYTSNFTPPTTPLVVF